jgi:transposase
MSEKKTHAATRYPLEFQKSSVKLAITNDQSITKTAKNLGISRSTLQNWISKYSSPGSASEINYLEEVKRLKKELHQTRAERDLRKKAAAFFAKASQ